MGKQKLEFSYFYADTEMSKDGFFQVPVLLLEHPAFKDVGYRAKNLYAFLFARAHQSAANLHKFSDADGKVFVFCTIKEIMEKMDCASEAAVKMLKDLEKVGLIEKDRRSNRATTIYVKNLYSAFDENGQLKQPSQDGKLQFDYINPKNISKYDFYKIPRVLIKNPVFAELRHGPKILYSLLLARTYNSGQNADKFVDDEGRIFIRFSIAEVMEKMNCQSQAAVRMLKDLEDFGLVEKKRHRMNEAAIIYVKDIYSIFDENGALKENHESEEPEETPAPESMTKVSDGRQQPLYPRQQFDIEEGKFWKALYRKLKKHIGRHYTDIPSAAFESG